jgi:hypothetical protein
VADKKFFFKQNPKSSAALVTLIVHIVFAVVAVSFVASEYILKEEQKFEAKPVERPKMTLKKLQVPVEVKKQQKPKLRKRIVVKPKINQPVPDIRMPEITGVKGGMGSGSGSQLGGAQGLGFSMPEFNIFGIRGKGEKIYFVLDATRAMMLDEIGGVRAYTIIKAEILRVISELPSTALFNVAVFDDFSTHQLFTTLKPATEAHAAAAEDWLLPLNEAFDGMEEGDWGADTLGHQKHELAESMHYGVFQDPDYWYKGSMEAMKQQADTVFVFTTWWGNQRHAISERDEAWFNTAAGKRWNACYQKALVLLDKENAERAARGEPPRSIRREHAWDMNVAYFPDIERPPEPEFYFYTPADYIKTFLAVRNEFKSAAAPLKSGVSRKSNKIDFSYNVVRFAKVNAEFNDYIDGRTERNFDELTRKCKGDYRSIAGLKMIQSSVKRPDQY